MHIQPTKLLFVDDDENNYVRVRDILSASTGASYVVEWVSTYEEAFHLTSVGTQMFDLYLIDFIPGNPLDNGLKLLETLRERDPFAPVIFLTEKGNREVDGEALKFGATDYLPKDDNLASILDRSIRYSLEHTRMLRSLEQSLSRTRSLENRFRQLIETAPGAILLINEAGGIMLVNERVETLFGYRRDELIGQAIETLLPEQFRDVHIEHRAGFFVQPGARPMGIGRDLAGRRKDGTEFPVEIGLSYTTTDEGTLALAFVTDITERKRAEENLKYSRAIIQSSQDAIIGKTLAGMIVSWNPGAEKIYGYEAEEVIGKPIATLVPKGRIDEVPDILRRIEKGEHIDHYETVRVRKDGSELEVSLTVSPIWNVAGVIVGASIVARDITKRKRAEEARRRSENRFRQLIETAPGAILLINEAGGIMLVNERVETLFGYRRDELIGQAIETLLPEQFRDVHIEHRAGFFAQPGARPMGIGRDLAGRRKDGTEFPVEIGLSYTTTDEGTLALAFVTDITERKRAEENILKSEQYNLATVNALSAHLAILDETGNILTVNQAWRNFAQANGLSVDYRWEGINYLQICDAAGAGLPEAAIMADGIRSVLNTENDQFEVEYPCHSPVEERWFVVRVTRFSTDDSIRVVVAHENVTARKKAELALQHSEANLRAILDNSELTYVLMDSEQHVLLANHAAQRGARLVFGRSIQPGDLFSKFLSDWNRDSFYQNFSSVLRGKIGSSELSFVTTQGQSRHFSFRYFPAVESDGTILGICLSTQDITERKQAENALRESEERYRIISDMISDFAFCNRVEPDGTWVTEWETESFLQLSGYTPEEAEEQQAKQNYWLFHPDDRARADAEMAQLLQDKIVDGEYRIITKNGEQRWLYLYRQPVWDVRQQRVTHYYGVAQEITARKRAEAEVQRYVQRREILHKIDIGVIGATSIPLLIETTVKSLRELIACQRVSVILFDRSTEDWLVLSEDASHPSSLGQNIRRPIPPDWHEGFGPARARIVNDLRLVERPIPAYKQLIQDGLVSGIQALLMDGDQPVGLLGLNADTPGFFTQEHLEIASEIADQLAIAIRQLKLSEALDRHTQLVEETRQFLQTTLDSFPANTAVLDANGTLIAVNLPWKRFADENNGNSPTHYLGTNYLTVCDNVVGHRSIVEDATSAATGIRAVIAGYQDEFTLEYSCGSPTQKRWFMLRVTPFTEPAPRRVVIAHINISERKTAEEALHESESRFRLLVENSPIGFYMSGDDYRVLYANPRLSDILGYSLAEVTQNPFTKFIAPEDVDQLVENYLRRRRGDNSVPYHYQFSAIRKDGQKRRLDLYITRIVSPGGKTYTWGQVLDVTERIQTEEALRESEERYRTLVRHFPGGGVYLFDRDLRYQIADGQDLPEDSLYGRAMEGKTIWEALPLEDQPRFEALYRAVLAGESLSVEMPFSGFIFQMHGTPIKNWRGEIVAGLVATQDVTERKLTEESFRQSQQRLRIVTDNIRDMIVQTDEKGIIQYVSPSSQQVWGLIPNELVGMPLSRWLERVHVADREALREILSKTVATDTGPGAWSYRFQDASGQFRWKEHIVSSFTQADGSLGGFIYVVRDITERITANEEIQKANERFSKVFHASPIGISISTLNEGRYLEVNQAFVQMYGFERAEDLIGKTFVALGTWPQIEDRPRMIEGLRGVQSRSPVTYPFRHQSGSLHEALCVAEVIELSGEEFVLSMFQDITAQKKAEAELELYRQHLEDLVAMRTKELEALTQKLQTEVVERQLAETAEREQRIMVEGLRNIAVALNKQVNLDAVLEELIANVSHVVAYDTASLMLIEEGMVRSVRTSVVADVDVAFDTYEGPIAESQVLSTLFKTQELLLISDTRTSPLWTPPHHQASLHSYLGTPLVNLGEVIGFINLGSTTSNYFTPESMSRLRMFAEQAAVAIQNARLYQQIGEVAVWRERQRISRELHDAVTQTMFSANIIAETLLRLWNTDPAKVPPGLRQLQSLTGSAVAEARNLLFDLRPEAMDDVKLSRLIGQLAQAFEGRTGIKPALDIPDYILIPREIKGTLYWLTHEALNNIAKHAQATSVEVSLIVKGQHLYLVIRDDGQGFDAPSSGSGQLGLKIMRERAASIQAIMEVSSQPNHGTTVSVRWQNR